jgi:hypothetical protein
MAKTPVGTQLTDGHRRQQLAIRAQALRDFTRLWPLWNGDQASFEQMVAAALPVMGAYHRVSSALAARYFEQFRAAERIKGDARGLAARPLDRDKAFASLMVTGQRQTQKAILSGASPQAAMQTALVRTSGTVTRMVLDGGRDALALSTATDRQATGWHRVTSGDPCAFCAVVASRGAVFGESSADFEAHDHCACFAEPAYPGSPWPGRNSEFRRIYNQHASGTANPINEMRKALATA